MTGCRVLLTHQTMASSDAQMDLVAGSGTAWDEAIQADLLFENSAAVLAVAEQHGTQRPELVLEGGMDARMTDVMRRAGAHFENSDKSGEGRAPWKSITSGRAECCNICLLTLCESGLVYILASCQE
jgi:hypothetical protein